MAKYHVNPATGVPSQCGAVRGRCPFGGDDDHATTAVEAVKKLEKRLKAETKGEVYVGKQKLSPSFARYLNGGGLAIEYFSNTEGPYAHLTVNLPGVPLAEDEVVINANLYDPTLVKKAEQAGFFTLTGREVKSGYVTYPVAKLSERFYGLALENLPPEEPIVPCDGRHAARIEQQGYCPKCGGVQ